MRQIVFIAFAIMLGSAQAEVRNDSLRTYLSSRVTGNAPVTDGILSESEWPQQGWASDFAQHRPLDDQPATQKTSFNILYDNDHLYVAFRMMEKDPE